MSKHHPLVLSLLTLALAATPAAWAATPESGELTETAPLLEWEGDGPYLFTNVTPLGGADAVLCEPSVPALCDQFEIVVNIADEFRMKEENQRESVKIAIAFPAPTGQEDYDMYLYDAGGALIGESATGGQEAITVPLKTFKNGSYTVTVVPFAPLATNYSGSVQLGKAVKAASAGLSLAPQAGSAPLTVRFDARALTATAPAGGYVFDFGDGSLPATDADGVIEHTYLNDGQYLSRVSYGDAQGLKATHSAAQPVFVGALAAAGKSGSTTFGGALGLGALLGLISLAGLRRRAAR